MERHFPGGTQPDKAAGAWVQASDSLSFLEVNGRLVTSWVVEGETSLDNGIRKLDWMYERIAVPKVRELALPLHERAVAGVREEVAAAQAVSA